jgi:MFS family permease
MKEDNRLFHWAWIILGVSFVNLFINYSVRLGYGVVLPEMIKDLGINRTQAGSIFNAYLFTYVTIAPFTGYLTDRFGPRRIIASCAFILGTGVLLMGTVRSLVSAHFYYALVGLGATGMWGPVITVVQRWFAVRRRGLALGILSTGFGLGFATMGAVFPWIVGNYTWRHAWLFLGAGAFGLVALDSILLRNDPAVAGKRPWGESVKGSEPSKTVQAMGKGGGIRDVFRSASFWRIGISYFCISYGLYAVTTFMVDYAKYQLGLPIEKASYLATVHGLSQVIGVLGILPLSDYLGRKKTILISNTAIAAAIGGIILSGHSVAMLYVSVGVMAVFYGVTFPIYGACAGDYFPKEVMATVIGAWTPFYGCGAICSHWISGILRDRLGVYDHAFIVGVAMALVGIFFMAIVKRSAHESEVKKRNN